MKAGDTVTNSVSIQLQTSKYTGGAGFPCKADMPLTFGSEIKVEHEFFLSTSFLFGVRLGEYAKLDALPDFTKHAGHLRYVKDSQLYHVHYPDTFQKDGMAILTSLLEKEQHFRSRIATESFVRDAADIMSIIGAGTLRMKVLSIHHHVQSKKRDIDKVYERTSMDSFTRIKELYDGTNTKELGLLKKSLVYVRKVNSIAAFDPRMLQVIHSHTDGDEDLFREEE